MKWTDVQSRIVCKFLLDGADLADDSPGKLGQTMSGRRGQKALARPDEKLRVQFRGEVLKLKADSAWREVDMFGPSCDAAVFHDSEEDFDLPNVH